jgi:hypothetical protein
MNNFKDFLLSTLEIIDYQDNKEEFINKYISTLYLEAVNRVLIALPQEEQVTINQELSKVKSDEELSIVVSSNFDQNAFQKELEETSKDFFQEYLETIKGSLTEEQKEKLDKFFKA